MCLESEAQDSQSQTSFTLKNIAEETMLQMNNQRAKD